jgi:hypothetical protein
MPLKILKFCFLIMLPFQRLNEYIPASAATFQRGLQKSLVAKNQRIVFSLSATAEERYNDFIKRYPSLIQRVPQHMLFVMDECESIFTNDKKGRSD